MAFDSNIFLKENLINGLKNGSFTPEQANIFACNYNQKGLISADAFSAIQNEANILSENFSLSDNKGFGTDTTSTTTQANS